MRKTNVDAVLATHLQQPTRSSTTMGAFRAKWASITHVTCVFKTDLVYARWRSWRQTARQTQVVVSIIRPCGAQPLEILGCVQKSCSEVKIKVKVNAACNRE